MKKPWSITTTLRNPERLRNFLVVLRQLENLKWSPENQKKYQILLIQNRAYGYGSRQFYNGLSREQITLINDASQEISFERAKEIFNAKNYKDPAMRGRQSINPLKKIGLVVIRDGKVVITALGRLFLKDDFDFGEIFLRSFLKWQIPNLASRSFTESSGFAIKPFIGILHLINEVNKRWTKLKNDPIGISKDEFSLFASTLIDYKSIERQAEKLIEYRISLRSQKDEKNKKKIRNRFRKDFAKTFLGTSKSGEVTKLLNNLKDYGDNAIRYFRLTRYLHIRGAGFYVDLEPRRSIEIEKLLATDNAAPLVFENADEYIEYLADIERPVLPWETKPELEKIAENLSRDIQSYISDLKSKAIKIPAFDFQEIRKLSTEQLKQYIEGLRVHRRKLQELEIHFESQDISKIQEYINALKNIHRSSSKKSIELERLSTLALNALNDALEIKPNYPVGDDNEPTFTAPANKPDIECFYEKFNSVCEVTMLTNRSQWYNEGQPVMRHMRDFEESHTDKVAYCLFIAPRLHQDTVETFWVAIKYGYKGAMQKIVPLSITEFIRLLESLLEIRKQGKRFIHDELLNLYEQILGLTDRVTHSEEWIEQIPKAITEWQESILTKQ